MNKWEDSFKKNEQCFCSNNQGLFVPNRQLSFIVAGLLFLVFCVFMTGYFLGKKNVVEQFSEKIQQEAFADQVYTSILAQEQEEVQATTPTLMAEADIVEMPTQSINQEVSVAINEENEPRYYAQLIGFGTEKSAQLFVKKLAAKGIETEIKKRTSKTVKGKVSYWYQVITTAYSNKHDLTELVNRIAREENIKDANIRVC